MNENKFIRLNTAFKPPKYIAEKAIVLSREISKENGVFFVLDAIHFHPHITIYSPEYPKSNIDKILKIIEKITSNTAKLKFQFLKISGEQGFISVKFNYSPEIKSFHEEIVTKLNPLREGRIKGRRKEGSDYQMNFNPEQKENIKKYGYPDAMNLYSPHLTITRLKEESSVEQISKNLNWDISQFTVDEIGVYKMGEHGTCQELVKEFNLR